jgi:DNA-binding NarL/FixJ family response regulator/RNA polymerase-binding transcription factor DksA
MTTAREQLMAERALARRRMTALQREFDAIAEAAGSAGTDDEHDPEGATLAFERQHTAALLGQAREQLAAVEAALDSLEAGRYGMCTRCGQPIGKERLAARPAALTCTQCAARLRRGPEAHLPLLGAQRGGGAGTRRPAGRDQGARDGDEQPGKREQDEFGRLVNVEYRGWQVRLRGVQADVSDHRVLRDPGRRHRHQPLRDVAHLRGGDLRRLLRRGLQQVPRGGTAHRGRRGDHHHGCLPGHHTRAVGTVHAAADPDTDGCPLASRPGEDVRIIILTTFDLDQYVYAALAAGASGFLLKDVSPEHLVAAVRLVRTGDALLAPSITRRLVERFAPRGPASEPGALDRDTSALTPRELEVLGLIARGLSNSELASALTLSEATVKTHVARILTKLQLRDRVQAVVLAYETGLVSPGAGPRES